jgi:hypothetical protein
MAGNLLTFTAHRRWRTGSILVTALCVCGFARGNDLVGVLLTGPRVGTVGEQVAFEVELVNRSGQPLTQLRVIDYFDQGLRHPASASPIEQKGTVDLAAGTSRRLTLEFQLVEAGRQCHRVEILDPNNQAVGGGTACIEAVPADSPAAAASSGQGPAPGGRNMVAGSAAAGPLTAAGPPPPVAAGQPPVAGFPPPAGGQPSGGQVPQPPSGPTPVPEAGSAPRFSPGGGQDQPPTGGAETATAPVPPGGTAPPWQNGQNGSLPPQLGQPLAAPKATLPNMAALATNQQSKAAFEVSLKGPSELLAGSMAEFVVTVRNIGTSGSSPASLEVSWDSALTPLEASDGYTLGRNTAAWTLPAIAAGGDASRQINFQGVATTGNAAESGTRACVRTVLGGLPGGGMVADEACVLIRSAAPPPRTPGEAGLRLNLSDLDDPVRFGSGTTLVCTISNDGERPTGPLDLTITLPEQARIVGNPIPSRVRIDGPRVTFDAISSLPPGGRSTFEVVYRMAGAGNALAEAVVSGQALDGKLEASCATTFLGP